MTRDHQDISCSARGLIDIYGAGAEEEARTKVQRLARLGDVAEAATWSQILGAVQDLQRSLRSENEKPS